MCGILALFISAVPAVQAELPPLIPREVLFGNPERISPHDYTAFQGVRAQVTATDPNFPDEMLLELNLRSRPWLD